jgi:hypothetical protein
MSYARSHPVTPERLEAGASLLSFRTSPEMADISTEALGEVARDLEEMKIPPLAVSGEFHDAAASILRRLESGLDDVREEWLAIVLSDYAARIAHKLAQRQV